MKLDPDYGMAWSLMAEAVLLKTDSGWLDSTEGYERVRRLAQHALVVSPENAHAHAMLLYVHRTLDWDWAAAETEARRALALDPTNPTVLEFAGILSRTLGRWAEAERQTRAALVRDPPNPVVIYDLGVLYYRAGRYAEAEAMYRKVLDLAPEFSWARYSLGKTLLAQDKPDVALIVVEQDTDEEVRLQMLANRLAGLRPPGGGGRGVDEAHCAMADRGAYYVAQTYAYRGDHDLALQWLERAYAQKDAALVEIVDEPLFNGLADDARFSISLQDELADRATPAGRPHGNPRFLRDACGSASGDPRGRIYICRSDRFVHVPIKVQQPNGVDFCIAFYLGEYLTRMPDAEYVILSKDKKGFGPQHLAGQRGFRVRRVNSQAEVFAASAKAVATKAIKKSTAPDRPSMTTSEC